MIVDQQLLRQTLGLVGRAGRILADQFDLLAGDRVAVLLHVELDAVVHLRGRICELAGIGHEQADLDGVLRACGNDCARQAQQTDQAENCFTHVLILPVTQLPHEQRAL